MEEEKLKQLEAEVQHLKGSFKELTNIVSQMCDNVSSMNKSIGTLQDFAIRSLEIEKRELEEKKARLKGEIKCSEDSSC